MRSCRRKDGGMRVPPLKNGEMPAALKGGGMRVPPRRKERWRNAGHPGKGEGCGLPPPLSGGREDGEMRSPEGRTEGCGFPAQEERTEGCGERREARAAGPPRRKAVGPPRGEAAAAGPCAECAVSARRAGVLSRGVGVAPSLLCCLPSLLLPFIISSVFAVFIHRFCSPRSWLNPKHHKFLFTRGGGGFAVVLFSER